MTTAGVPIYYGYKGSPFVAKFEALLLLKHIPARGVDVALVPPRPELAALLGLPYRRVPVLALGRDLYADTSLIASVLERRFPAAQGHPSLFPPRKGAGGADTGLQKAFAQFYADNLLFQVAFRLFPWSRMPPALRADREELSGGNLDFIGLPEQRNITFSQLASHLTLYEEQLRDGREWLLDTESPGLIDVSLWSVLSWIRSAHVNRPVFDTAQFPRTVAWLDRMELLLKQKRQASPPLLAKMSGADAAKEILSSPFQDISEVGFDEVEAKRLGVRPGTRVAVRPDGAPKDVDTVGRLVALTREEVVLETEAQAGGPGAIRVHFPRLAYVLRETGAVQARL